MLVDLVPGCAVEVERGPNWLFVRLPDADASRADLAERVFSLLEKGFTHRLVLEMDAVARLNSSLIGELVQLYERIAERGGVMRIAGLSDDNQGTLIECELDTRFPQYCDREAAVMGLRPRNPR